MPIEFVDGDLLASGLPAVAHGCNIVGSMGGGIAAQFADRYPEMEGEYERLCAKGQFRLGEVMVWDAKDTIIFNLATQPLPGPSADLQAVERSLSRAIELAEERGLEAVGVPRIGAGIGGLVWEDVREVMERVASQTSVRLVVFERYVPSSQVR